VGWWTARGLEGWGGRWDNIGDCRAELLAGRRLSGVWVGAYYRVHSRATVRPCTVDQTHLDLSTCTHPSTQILPSPSPLPFPLPGHGKIRLHAKLRSAGYTLALSPAKSGSRAQGATDVDVACCLFTAAGAFSPSAQADAIVLIAGDADFLPAIRAVLQARGPGGTHHAWPRSANDCAPDIGGGVPCGAEADSNADGFSGDCGGNDGGSCAGGGSDGASGGGPLRVVVCAGQGAVSRRYRDALDLEAGASFVSLDGLLGSMAPNVVDLRGARRPRGLDGGTDVRAVLAALHAAQRASRAAPSPAGGKASKSPRRSLASPPEPPRAPLLTLHLSGPGGPAFSDEHTIELVDGLLAAGAGSVTAILGQVWVHHTCLSDVSCAALSLLVTRASALREVHLSDCDPGISLGGVEQLAVAAKAAGYGSTRPHKLYINARHLALTPESVALQRAYSQSITLRMGGPRSGGGEGGGRATGGRGRGRGSPSGPGIGGRGSPSTPKHPHHGSSDALGRVGGRGSEGRGGRSAVAQAAARLAGRGKGSSPGGRGAGMPVPALGGGKGANGAGVRRSPPAFPKGKGKGG
jgi:hypothetical protein